MKYFHHLQMIEYCRLPIEYLRNSIDFNRKKKSDLSAVLTPVRRTYYGRRDGRRERYPQIFNFQYSLVNSCLSGLGLLSSAHPETGVSGFTLSALSIQLSAKDIKNKNLADC